MLDVARAAFAARGGAVTMEEVARSAGVGIGTLYRHFPNRNDLVVEVYKAEMARLLEAAHDLARTEAPREALRQWLLLFVDKLADHIALADALKALAGEKAKEDAGTTELLARALDLLLTTPVAENRLPDPGIEGLDFLRALYGLATITPTPNWPVTARRMVNIMIEGMASAS